MSELFTNPSILEEYPSHTLNVKQEEEVDRIAQRLIIWAGSGKCKMVAYVGDFGSGKTTILDRVKSELRLRKTDFKCMTFEVWRYANREQIWDGFIIETASFLASKENKTYKKQIQLQLKVADQIDGDRLESLERYFPKTFLGRLRAVFGIILLSGGLAVMLWCLLQICDDCWPVLLTKSLLKYWLPIIISLLALTGLVSLLPKTKKPLKRIFELEDILYKSLANLSHPLIVVIEDIDRSDNEGMIFLETLRNFIKDQAKEFQSSIIVIAPQSKLHLDLVNNPGVNGFDRSLKIYDSVIYSNTAMMDELTIDNLYNQLIVKRDFRQRFTEASKSIFIRSSWSDQLNIRKVKFILRGVDDFIDAFPGADLAIVLFLITSKYVCVRQERGGSLNATAISMIGNTANIQGVRSAYAEMFELLYLLAGGQGRPSTVSVRFELIDHEMIVDSVDNSQGDFTTATVTLDSKYKALI